jgi:hypothetical protein
MRLIAHAGAQGEQWGNSVEAAIGEGEFRPPSMLQHTNLRNRADKLA